MSNANPYREGSDYNKLFGHLKAKQVVTRKDLISYSKSAMHKTEAQATADVTVILSPRKDSKRGDCRGNMSAQGHVYFMEKLPRKTVKGVKEPQKFRLRYRSVPLEARKRSIKLDVPAQKVENKATVKTVKTVKTADAVVK
jgi:hypothetical protein